MSQEATITREQEFSNTVRKAIDFFDRGVSGQHDCDQDTWRMHARTHVTCAREALLSIDQRFVELLPTEDPLELTPEGEAVLDEPNPARKQGAESDDPDPADVTPEPSRAVLGPDEQPSEYARKIATLPHDQLMREVDRFADEITAIKRELLDANNTIEQCQRDMQTERTQTDHYFKIVNGVSTVMAAVRLIGVSSLTEASARGFLDQIAFALTTLQAKR